MAYQDNLNKVAEEFAMMDELCSRLKRMERRPQENPVIQTPYRPKVIDSTQAVKRYGGVMEVTGRRPGVQRYEEPPKQSVVHQGGVWIMDYSKRKSRFMAY